MRLHKSTPRLQKAGEYYNIIFYDPETRRRKWHSLGTNKKDLALRRYREMCEAYEHGWNPFTTKYAGTDSPALHSVIERYCEQTEVEWSKATRRDYRTMLLLFEKSLPAGILLRHVNESDLRRFLASPKAGAAKEAKRRATQRGYFTRLRAFFNWSVDAGLISTSPLPKEANPKAKPTPPEYLTRAEYASLLYKITEDAALAVREAVRARRILLARLLRFDVNSGLRREELITLKWKHIDFEAGRMTITGKGGKTRVVPLFPAAREVLDEMRTEYEDAFGALPRKSDRVFVGMSANALTRMFKDYVRALRLDERYSLHSLRHTFCSWAVQGGVDIYQVKEWAGHVSIQTTQVYARLSPHYVPEVAVQVFS